MNKSKFTTYTTTYLNPEFWTIQSAYFDHPIMIIPTWGPGTNFQPQATHLFKKVLDLLKPGATTLKLTTHPREEPNLELGKLLEEDPQIKTLGALTNPSSKVLIQTPKSRTK